nr:hypothetical protein L203_02000 [Cryptococcus depauperatus CBS 7841]
MCPVTNASLAWLVMAYLPPTNLWRPLAGTEVAWMPQQPKSHLNRPQSVANCWEGPASRVEAQKTTLSRLSAIVPVLPDVEPELMP